ncbi:MAG TPA: NAD+ synthase [Acidobacteriota bacterium]|nr:NAD+ synthase [Acidobacteriota bacterium]
MSAPITDIDLTVDPLLTIGILINFITDELRRKGFRKVVTGLSGGLDSAFGAALLVNALDAEPVTALTMPADQSDPQSLADAELVARSLGIRLVQRPIGGIVAAMFAGEKRVDRVRLGNAAARARMMQLFDYSQEHRALVVGTSNKSELLLGYGTWYGDLACSINPIGDLYKTQIRQLAGFLDLPRRIIDKPPSADLWIGQTDEGELGFTYETVDRLLFLLVDQEYSVDQVVARGFDRALVDRVVKLIASTQFKRSLPTIAKLSSRTVGIDFHLARDWLR